MTKWHVDNFMTHIAALTLIVDDYVSDTFDIREDLRLKPTEYDTRNDENDELMLTFARRMKQYFSEIGVHLVSASEPELQKMKLTRAHASMHQMAKLKLPLQFPKQRKMPASRQR